MSIEHCRTLKATSGLGLGWMDGWIGYLRVVVGIEHLTVLINGIEGKIVKFYEIIS